MRLRWLLLALLLASVVAAANFYANAHALYWRYTWIDVPIHYLGGLFLAVMAVALFDKRRPFFLIAVVVAIAVGWEIFEVFVGVPRENQSYILDTSIDILMDALGAITAYILARFTVWRSV